MTNNSMIKTRIDNLINIKTMEPYYGISVKIGDAKWIGVADNNKMYFTDDLALARSDAYDIKLRLQQKVNK